MQTSLEARHRTLKLACLTALVLLAQGCATTPTVYRGVTPQAAAEYVAKVVGTAEPSGTTLARYYQEEETYRSWSGTWNCNGKLITVTLNNLVITPGPGNSVETAVTFDGSCNGASTNPWIRVGRYNNSYLLLYDPSAPTTFIYEYEITKDPYRVAPKLIFRGSTQYIDEVWGLRPARKHLSPVTGNKIAESGGPADIYETSGYLAQANDPRPTAKEDRMAIERNESRSLHETARGIDDRRNERIRDDKAADRAALVAGINQMARDNADALAQRDAAMVRATEATRVANDRAAQERPVTRTVASNSPSLAAQSRSERSAIAQPKPKPKPKPKPSPDPDPYKKDIWKWRLNGNSSQKTRDVSCREAKARADSDNAKTAALGKARVVGVSPCVCEYADFLNGESTASWICNVYVSVESIKRDGPTEGVSR